MKKIVAGLFVASLVFAGCSNAPANQEAEKKENIADAVSSEQENAQENFQEEFKGQYVMEEMNIDDNGTKIYGRMYLPVEEKDSYPLVIMSHGIGGTYENCEPYAMMCAANGIAAFAFDFQGGGPASQSDGEMVDMSTLTEAQDLEVVSETLKQLPYVQKENVFLFGESQGGFVSAYVSANHPDAYNSVVLLYPAFVLQNDAWEKYPEGPETALDVEEIYGLMVGKQSYIDNMSFDIYDVIKGYPQDVLIIHGQNDPVVPLSYSDKAKEVYTSCEIIPLDGPQDHGFKGEQITLAGQHTIDFVKEHLK
ncbi:MAG: YqiA/YcfP family alpha/beta fold hydrolase [Bacillota bacterium]|nr:YqiA/YcfP family alpha/beta fold hydrolase [Bacillota bacterium]